MCSAAERPTQGEALNATAPGNGTSYTWSRDRDVAPAPFIWQLRKKGARGNFLGIRQRDGPPSDLKRRAVQVIVLGAFFMGAAISLFFGFSRPLLPGSFIEEPQEAPPVSSAVLASPPQEMAPES